MKDLLPRRLTANVILSLDDNGVPFISIIIHGSSFSFQTSIRTKQLADTESYRIFQNIFNSLESIFFHGDRAVIAQIHYVSDILASFRGLPNTVYPFIETAPPDDDMEDFDDLDDEDDDDELEVND